MKNKENEIKNLLDFFIEVGQLKRIKRSGWVLRGVNNSESIADHSFRLALIAWFLGKKKKLDIKKIIKMALLHDLCEIYAGDTTPYDKILFNNKTLLIDKKKRRKLFADWPRFSQKEKKEFFNEKYKKETQALKKLTTKLAVDLREEIRHLWRDYENGLTKEGRFVRQVDRIENLLQAFEYKKEDKALPIRAFYVQIKELVDDPILLAFIKAMDKKFKGL